MTKSESLIALNKFVYREADKVTITYLNSSNEKFTQTFTHEDYTIEIGTFYVWWTWKQYNETKRLDWDNLISARN